MYTELNQIDYLKSRKYIDGIWMLHNIQTKNIIQ